jgi:gamma-glutamylcyclotransferase (GGCT)/AIG2-like uncharacterized protein YtfP
MQKNDLVFVYGTLRKGERMSLDREFGDVAGFVGNDVINGRMYSLGAYPGVKDVPNEFDHDLPCVYGEVYRIRDTSIIAILDAYEGYCEDSPTTGLYNRKVTETLKGRKVWVYIFNGKLLPVQLIDSGDWKKGTNVVELRQLRSTG